MEKKNKSDDGKQQSNRAESNLFSMEEFKFQWILCKKQQQK